MMAWFSRNSPRGRFRNETIAQPLAIISMRIIKLDNYLDKNVKWIVLYIALFFVFSLLNSFKQPITFFSSIIILLNLVILSLLYVGFKLKKSLIFENRQLFNALVFNEIILKKVLIDTKKFNSGKIKKLEQSNSFWPFFGPITALIREYNATSIILLDSKKNEMKILSLTNMNSTKEAIKFIEKYTEVKFINYTF